VGKRQRHSDLTHLSPEELERMAKDKSRPVAERRRFVTELKFHKLRNRQKRSK
jgi:hypothetical protein